MSSKYLEWKRRVLRIEEQINVKFPGKLDPD